MYSDKRPSARRARSAGFSLMDTLMATALMTVGLLGMSAGTIQLTRSAKLSDMTAAATGLATKELELLRSKPLTAAVTGSYSGGQKYANGSPGGPYLVAWVVSAKDVPTWGLKTVTVTTSWSQFGTTHQVQVSSFIRCSKTPC